MIHWQIPLFLTSLIIFGIVFGAAASATDIYFDNITPSFTINDNGQKTYSLIPQQKDTSVFDMTSLYYTRYGADSVFSVDYFSILFILLLLFIAIFCSPYLRKNIILSKLLRDIYKSVWNVAVLSQRQKSSLLTIQFQSKQVVHILQKSTKLNIIPLVFLVLFSSVVVYNTESSFEFFPNAYATGEPWCDTVICDTDWALRTRITIDNTQVGGSSGSLTNFPMLVSLSGSDFTDIEGNIQNNGTDIRFTTLTGTVDLDYEIESYDESADTMAIWVQIPTLSKSADTEFFMYYGNPAATSAQNAANVWDSNYAAVYHLNQTSGGTNSTRDSTSSANHGSDFGSPTFTATGQIGNAISFDGVDDFIDLDDTGFPVGQTAKTLSVWMQADNTSSGFHFGPSIGNPNIGQVFFFGRNADTLVTGGFGDDISIPSFWNNNLHYLVLTYDGTTAILYSNGTEISSSLKTWNLVSENAYIGRQVNNAEYWNGVVDEMRYSNIVRTCRLDYN